MHQRTRAVKKGGGRGRTPGNDLWEIFYAEMSPVALSANVYNIL